MLSDYINKYAQYIMYFLLVIHLVFSQTIGIDRGVNDTISVKMDNALFFHYRNN